MTRILQPLPGWLIRPSKIDSYWVNIYIHISSTYHLRVCDTPVLHGIFQLWSLQPPLWWLHHHLTQPKSCCLTPQKALSSLEKNWNLCWDASILYYIQYPILRIYIGMNHLFPISLFILIHPRLFLKKGSHIWLAANLRIEASNCSASAWSNWLARDGWAIDFDDFRWFGLASTWYVTLKLSRQKPFKETMNPQEFTIHSFLSFDIGTCLKKIKSITVVYD